MKRLILNNFIYYKTSKTKLFISFAFIISFFFMLNVYDELELQTIRSQSDHFRVESYSVNLLDSYIDFKDEQLNTLNFWDEVYPVYEPIPGDLFNGQEFLGYFYDGDNQEILEHLAIIKELREIESPLSSLLNDYSTLYSGGRMNVELTPYRYEINKIRLELLELVGEETTLHLLSFESPQSENLIRANQIRYEKLMNAQTPDDFNQYTVTFHNYPGKVFEGYMLFVILIFVLLLFYDLFSKDFEYDTYRTIYSSAYPRETIVKSKLAFSLIYTFILISIGMIITMIFLLLSKRIGYNVVASRVGYLFHPTLLNVNILSVLGQDAHYLVIPVIVKNLIVIFTGFLMIYMCLQGILYLSLKTKSSSTTLTVGVFILLASFFAGITSLKNVGSFVIPLFGFNFNSFIEGSSLMNIVYLILLLIIYNIVLSKIFKTAYTTDLLGGDHHD